MADDELFLTTDCCVTAPPVFDEDTDEEIIPEFAAENEMDGSILPEISQDVIISSMAQKEDVTNEELIDALNYYLLQPEIAGELGDSSEIIYEDGRLKEVQFLEFVVTGWLGDEILKARPCYIITKDIMNSFIENGITGAKYEGKVSFSEDFFDMYENVDDVPPFVRVAEIGGGTKDEC